MSEEKVFRLSLDVIWMRIIPESVINLENNLPIGLQTLVESNGEKTEVAEELSLTGLCLFVSRVG